jgi:hypothetical protein
MILAWLIGCPEPIVPLEGARTELAALDRVPMPVGWPAQATIVLSDAQVQALVTRFARAGAAKPELNIDGGMVTIRAVVTADPPHVDLDASPTCTECVALQGWGTGAVSLSAAGMSSALNWRSEVAAQARVDGSPRPDGFEIAVVPIERESWTVGLDVQGLPPVYGTMIEQALEHQIEVGIKDAGPLARAIPLATIPYDGLVRMRGLRTHYADGLAVDLGFSAMHSGAVHTIPAPGDGFAVAVPAETLLGLAHGALVRQGPIEGFQPEPTSIHLDNGKFELWLKIWKVSHKEKWREYVLRGTLALENGVIALHTVDATETGKNAWGGPLDPVVQAMVVDTLKKSLAIETPGSFVHPLGDQGAITVDLTRLDANNDVLTVWGNLR